MRAWENCGSRAPRGNGFFDGGAIVARQGMLFPHTAVQAVAGAERPANKLGRLVGMRLGGLGETLGSTLAEGIEQLATKGSVDS
jgi:hypothetical protein